MPYKKGPYCTKLTVKKNGKRRGIQRYYCTNCNKHSSLNEDKVNYKKLSLMTILTIDIYYKSYQ